ncbi:MAG: hypothetical protein R2757_11985 [Draconibacterium sp.]
MERRSFLKTSVLGGISLFSLPLISPEEGNGYQIKLDTATRLFDGTKCWAHPRAGIVPAKNTSGNPRVMMTMNSLDLAGSDVFRGMFGVETDDLGKSWSKPKEINTLKPRFEIIEGVERPVAASDFWPAWHRASKTLLGTGHTVAYTADWKVKNPRPRNTSYSVYNAETCEWENWRKLQMPEGEKFYNSGAGCSQRYDLDDGTVLLPISFKTTSTDSKVTVCKCSFDGQTLSYIENGDELSINDDSRGLGEPSLTRFQNKFFLTIRNDKRSFVASGNDGLVFGEYKPWIFDDGTELGSYNTQTHWVTHSDGLFLVYTRRGANNDHVFRHRAPLFIGQVDPERLCVIRETEQILVPERGARLGNFGVTDISQDETWVTVSEWMQPEGVEKYGSDGSVFVARIKWQKPNMYFKM